MGGFFPVPKPPKPGRLRRQRLIFDRRPQNATEHRLVFIRLPSAALFKKLQLKKSEVVRGSGKDLSSFYFCLRHAEPWWRRNGAGRRLAPRFVKKWASKYLGKKPLRLPRPHRLVLTATGMGDQNAVDVATAAHANILEAAGLSLKESGLSKTA